MHSDIQQSYLEGEVLTADPAKLVELMYRAALEAIGAARRHLSAGEILARSRQITKAILIVNELMLSLDHAQGGELSRSFCELYDYIQRLLIETNSKQWEPPLVEAEKLLTTLLEAWQNCGARSSQVEMSSLCEQTAAEHVSISCAY